MCQLENTGRYGGVTGTDIRYMFTKQRSYQCCPSIHKSGGDEDGYQVGEGHGDRYDHSQA